MSWWKLSIYTLNRCNCSINEERNTLFMYLYSHIPSQLASSTFSLILPVPFRTTFPASKTSSWPGNPRKASTSMTLRSRTCPSRWWMWAASALSAGAGLSALTRWPPSCSWCRPLSTTRWGLVTFIDGWSMLFCSIEGCRETLGNP